MSNFGTFFTMPAHQIWSYHVTQEANFENFLFCPNSIFNIRKSHKISCGKALYFRSYEPKPHEGGGGGKHPPVPLGLKNGVDLSALAHVLISLTTDKLIDGNFPLQGFTAIKGPNARI